MKSKFLIEKHRIVCDFIGKEISPGNVIAVSRSGRRSKALEAYIITAIRPETLILAGIKYWKPSVIVPAATRSSLFSSEIQSHIVLIDHPLYALENPQIKNLLQIADALKDNKIFPSSYKLGQAIM